MLNGSYPHLHRYTFPHHARLGHICPDAKFDLINIRVFADAKILPLHIFALGAIEVQNFGTACISKSPVKILHLNE
jgi:hypothetical protein